MPQTSTQDPTSDKSQGGGGGVRTPGPPLWIRAWTCQPKRSINRMRYSGVAPELTQNGNQCKNCKFVVDWRQTAMSMPQNTFSRPFGNSSFSPRESVNMFLTQKLALCDYNYFNCDCMGFIYHLSGFNWFFNMIWHHIYQPRITDKDSIPKTRKRSILLYYGKNDFDFIL